MGEHYQKVTIMDIDFINTSMDAFLNTTVYPCLAQEDKCFIVTANPEIVIAARDHPEFKETVKSADYVLADGIGVVRAAQMMGTPLEERVSGFDVMRSTLEHAAEKGYRVFFLGAEEASNRKTVENAEKKFPGLIVAGRQHGYVDVSDEKVVEAVVDSNPDIVLVALGMMRQENWIRDHIDRFDKGIFMGVGGSFDVISGKAKRAPDKWIKCQLEWLYRLIQEPKRITRVMKVGQFMLMHVPVVNKIMKLFGFSKTKPRKKG